MTLHFTAVTASRPALHILRNAGGHAGEIHSAYRRTINLRFPGDHLVCLHGGRDLVAPFGIALGRDFDSPAFERIAPGVRVVPADGTLRIPEAAVEVAIGRAAVWEPEARPRPLGSDAAARHAEILEAVLLQHDNPDGLAGLVDGADATPLLRRARPCAERLQQALARRDISGVLAAAEPLMGLGPGLTPSGDDFLAGLMGTALLAEPPAGPLLRAVGPQLLRLAETRTTLLSRAFLAHALEGVLAPPLDALAATMLDGADRPALARAARAACTLGHTSGMDTVTGMVFALRALAQAAP